MLRWEPDWDGSYSYHDAIVASPKKQNGLTPKCKQIKTEGCRLMGKEGAMRPIQIPAVSKEQIASLAELYRTTHDGRLRTRAQMVLLAEEQHLTVGAIAAIVRESEGAVRCWLKRYVAEGIEGLHRVVGGGAPAKVTQAYQDQFLQVVRRRPRSLGQPYSMWTDAATRGLHGGANRDWGTR